MNPEEIARHNAKYVAELDAVLSAILAKIVLGAWALIALAFAAAFAFR